MEDLKVSNMSCSAMGALDQAELNVAAKAGYTGQFLIRDDSNSECGRLVLVAHWYTS